MPPGCFSKASPLKKTSQICSIRIYITTFRAATKTDVRKPAVSVIRQICYPKSHSFTSEATRYS